MDTVGKQVRKHWYGMLIACLCCLLIGTGLSLIIGRSQTEYWIVFGGNGDPGNGNGDGFARGDFVRGGWIDNGHIFQVTWQADILANTRLETNAAMAAGHAAYDAHCRLNRCIIAGFSLGNTPAIQLASEVGLPTGQLYNFGGPQPSTGVFHNPFVRYPGVMFWTDTVGGLDQNQVPPAGSQAFYDTHDPFANGAPQCAGPGWFGIFPQGHYIISRGQANEHVWLGPDGVVMHEANYVPQPGVPVSGSDPMPWWSLCPINFQPVQIPTIPPGMPPVPGVPVGG